MPTKENPADIGSRGSVIGKLPKIWLKDPTWLCNTSEWPEQPYGSPTSESPQETKIASELVVTTIEKNNSLDKLLEKFGLWKVLRVSAWINRFINCIKTKVRGLLTTTKIEKHKKFWIKREQQRFRYTEKVKIDMKSLDL